MAKRKEQLGSSVPHAVSVEITEVKQYNEHTVCREIIIKCEDGRMDRRIELSGFGKDIPVKLENKGEREYECSACKPGRKRRKCYAICEAKPYHCLLDGHLVNWKLEEAD